VFGGYVSSGSEAVVEFDATIPKEDLKDRPLASEITESLTEITLGRVSTLAALQPSFGKFEDRRRVSAPHFKDSIGLKTQLFGVLFNLIEPLNELEHLGSIPVLIGIGEKLSPRMKPTTNGYGRGHFPVGEVMKGLRPIALQIAGEPLEPIPGAKVRVTTLCIF